MSLPPSFFDHLEDRLNLAVYDINQDYRMSAIDRIKAKALAARDIAPQAIRDFEADLDGIINEKAGLAEKRAEAVATHKEAISGIYSEIDGLKSAMDLFSNGAPPLPASAPSAPTSPAPTDGKTYPTYP